ncbi:19811_t:CDS:2, partial [Racocetra fulgida]
SVDAIVTGKFFDRIVVVVFENTGYTTAIAQPYLQDLTNRTTGLLFTSFYAIGHPNSPTNVSGSNLVDLLEAKDDPTRCAKIVDGNQLDADISANQVPQFVYYVPNQKNDAHDTNMTFAMNWF